MSHFLPNYSRMGSYLQPTQTSLHARPTVPLFRINSQRVPVISSLSPCDPRYRLVSFTTGHYSPPYSSVRCNEPSLCTKYKQYLVDVSSTPMLTISEAYPIGDGESVLDTEHGMCIQNEFVHRGESFQLSKMGYEILMHLNRFYSYASCYRRMHTMLDTEQDSSLHYEVTPLVASRIELQHPTLSPLNAHYETFSRFLCGSDVYDNGEDMRHILGLLQADFNMCLLDENIRDPLYKKRFTLHRYVSYK